MIIFMLCRIAKAIIEGNRTRRDYKRNRAIILLKHIVNGIYKGAGISGATSHSGRRTGFINLAEWGAGERVLMALAGHSQMAITQRYIHLRPAMLKADVELL